MESKQIKIDVTLVPDYVRDELAAATLDLIHSILWQPEGREALNAKTRVLVFKEGHKNSVDLEPQIEPQKPILRE